MQDDSRFPMCMQVLLQFAWWFLVQVNLIEVAEGNAGGRTGTRIRLVIAASFVIAVLNLAKTYVMLSAEASALSWSLVPYIRCALFWSS